METDKNLKMLQVSVKDMFDGKESRYALAMGIAKRAREISDENSGTVLEKVEKSVKTAEREFRNGEYSVFCPDINN